MAAPLRPAALSFNDGRQSPFRRQNSASPATVRAATPTSSPTKSNLSPSKAGSLSPEKASPFVRRPSQINSGGERPSSPFARPTSSLGIPGSPSRNVSNASSVGKNEEIAESPRVSTSPTRRTTPPGEREVTPAFDLPSTSWARSTPSPFDGPAESPSNTAVPSQANLRPTVQRTTTASSTTSTVRAPPVFNPTPAAPVPRQPPINTNATKTKHLSNSVGGYTHVPQPLLRSMRESFEVLDSSNTGTIKSSDLASMLEQMGMPNSTSALKDYFPPTAPAQLNLARYLDILSASMAELSYPEELQAAFEAFDVDDSGQVDVNELRKALLETAPEPGEEMVRMSEREVEGILGEFASRRQFGGKGVNVAKGKGEVFRYRDFMGAVTGGGGDAGVGGEGVVV